MLTKADLTAIKKIIREEVEFEAQKTREDLSGDLKLAEIRILNEIHDVKSRLKSVEVTLGKVQKDIKLVADFLDREIIKTVKRIERIEARLPLASAS